MGTSAAQRSPSTPEWERVRELYRHQNPDPGHIAAQVVAALDAPTVRAMSGPAVSLCLGAVLHGSARASADGLPALLQGLGAPAGPPAIQIASGLRGYAESQIVGAGVSSRFGDLALDAIGTLSLAVAAEAQQGGVFQLPASAVEAQWARYAREERMDALSAQFMAHDLDHAMRYFVARDLSEFVGTDAIPTVLVGSQLIERVGQYCRERTRGIGLSDFLPEISAQLAAPPSERLGAAEVLAPVVDAGLSQGLQLLSGGG